MKRKITFSKMKRYSYGAAYGEPAHSGRQCDVLQDGVKIGEIDGEIDCEGHIHGYHANATGVEGDFDPLDYGWSARRALAAAKAYIIKYVVDPVD